MGRAGPRTTERVISLPYHLLVQSFQGLTNRKTRSQAGLNRRGDVSLADAVVTDNSQD
jgi:hypothetical protein